MKRLFWEVQFEYSRTDWRSSGLRSPEIPQPVPRSYCPPGKNQRGRLATALVPALRRRGLRRDRRLSRLAGSQWVHQHLAAAHHPREARGALRSEQAVPALRGDREAGLPPARRPEYGDGGATPL